MSSAIYYMRQLKSALRISEQEPSILQLQPQPEYQSQLQTAADAMIGTIFNYLRS